jgi:hypothetical protein
VARRRTRWPRGARARWRASASCPTALVALVGGGTQAQHLEQLSPRRTTCCLVSP